MTKPTKSVLLDVHEEYRRIEHEVIDCDREIAILRAKRDALHEIETHLHCILADYGAFSYAGYTPADHIGDANEMVPAEEAEPC